MSYEMTDEHRRKISEAVRRYYEQRPEIRDAIAKRQTRHGMARWRRGLTPKLAYRIWAHAKARAKKAGLAFDLKPQDIVIPEKCPLLGIDLVAGDRKSHGASPSLDRIIPSRGYLKDNVWVISYRANAMKQDATLHELELLVHNLRQRSIQ